MSGSALFVQSSIPVEFAGVDIMKKRVVGLVNLWRVAVVVVHHGVLLEGDV